MKNATHVSVLVLVLVAGLAACSGGTGSPVAKATAAPAAAAVPAALQPTVGPQAATAAPQAAKTAPTAALQAAKTAPTAAATQATKGGASGGSNILPVTDAPMPANPAKYETARAVKIGEAVQLPKSGLIFQVTGVRTVPNDAKSEFVVADIVIGNPGNETQTISSLMMFGIVAGGWHWYGISLESLPQMVALKLPNPFDAEIAPGKAGKGSMPILVPVDATGLTLTFQTILTAEGTEPMVFVPLAIRGQGTLPLVTGDAPAVVQGKTYRVGEAFKATRRGLAMQVNGYWERAGSARNAQLAPDEKFVLVDVTAAPLPGGAALKRFNELSLRTADGQTIRQTHEDGDGDVYLAESVGADNGVGRGVAVFRVPKSAKGLKLSFDPIDPAAPGFAFGSGEPLAAEQAFFDLSGGAAVVPAAIHALPTVGPTATAKAPTAGDPASVPAELKGVLAPPGFTVVKDSAERYVSDNKLQSATVKYFGQGDIKTVKEFFKKNLTESAGFELADEDLSSSGPNEGDLSYGYTRDGVSYGLSVMLVARAGGVEIELILQGE